MNKNDVNNKLGRQDRHNRKAGRQYRDPGWKKIFEFAEDPLSGNEQYFTKNTILEGLMRRNEKKKL